MQIKLFATLRDRAQAGEITVSTADSLTVRELRAAVAEQFPALAALMKQTLVAVNQQFAFNDDLVKAGDEVALFPPVSGGMDTPTILRITADPIDLNDLQRAITTERDGAVVIFTGTVRRYTGSETTDKLAYEAYTEMAVAKLEQIAREMRERFADIHGIALVQRVGEMQVCEPTVAVAVTAGHRGDGAFEAARYGIDRLKQIVPVWKKETRPDGSSWVEGDYTPMPGD
ncbi:MAG: molybdopterin converting factor subunit 1 [Chloroflexi bacterium]|nr:molybdopterin converting factor subunit 1 [Chloroflexota bacterium]MCL5273468.1 molybdopterin converting factor subunit 1 [Chloroflexota bacterium]